VKLTYPSKDEELAILNRMAAVEPNLFIETVLTPQDLSALRGIIDQVYVDDKIKRYIVDIVHATRKPSDYGLDIGPYVQLGASPRATIFLTRAARAQAFLDGRGYVTPQDVKSIGPDVLRHRVSITYEAEAEDVTAESLLQRIFDSLKVP
jgi:MoxR-like ATPase